MGIMWQIVAELGRSMAQVVLNWVVNRPGVASVIPGASQLHQLQDNLGPLEFQIPHHRGDRSPVSLLSRMGQSH